MTNLGISSKTNVEEATYLSNDKPCFYNFLIIAIIKLTDTKPNVEAFRARSALH